MTIPKLHAWVALNQRAALGSLASVTPQKLAAMLLIDCLPGSEAEADLPLPSVGETRLGKLDKWARSIMTDDD